MSSNLNSVNSDFVIDATGGNDLVLHQDGVEVGRAGAGGFGKVLQEISEENFTFISSAALIQVDDTIPQITEGVEIISKIFTPKLATSTIRIQAKCSFSNSTASTNTCALFKDSVADSISSCINTVATGHVGIFDIDKTIPSIGIAPITFSLRAGGNGGTININGSAGSRKQGGTLSVAITITEIGA